MSGAHGNGPPKKCGLFELLVFIAAIITGTACSILSKTMMGLHGEGITGEIEVFEKPIFQTFGMFVGMCFGLVMHFVVMIFKIPFPGYDLYAAPTGRNKKESASLKHSDGITYGAISETDPLVESGNGSDAAAQKPPTIPVWMYFFLAIPAIFDLAATALCMMGLQYIDVSIYQLLRGSGIIFVALMKQYVLGDRLYSFQWVGVIWNIVSVFLVGGTAILNEKAQSEGDLGGETSELAASSSALLGVMLVMMGALVQAMQFVFEEKVMTMDIPSPPLLLIGMEGLWGTILCVFVIYPLAFYIPGSDHGSYEDPFNTYAMFMNSPHIQIAFVIYFFAIFGYNFFAVLVTFMLNSVWHAILDNFRPITVWLTDLLIFYAISSSFGEPWTHWSYIQVAGMAVLLYGTAVYNAPNAGSVWLEGQWYSLGLDFTSEYTEIQSHEKEEQIDEEWEQRMVTFKVRKESSFFGERSPHISVHTQALRGLGGSHL